MLPEDLEYFLPAVKAAKAFELLDVDADGKVTLHDIRDAVLNVYKAGPSASYPIQHSFQAVRDEGSIVAACCQQLA